MTTSKPITQPPTERRAAEAELRALIAKFAPAHLRLINALRRSLRKRLPSAFEVIYEYNGFFVISISPTEKGYEGVLGIRAREEGVKLYFNQGKDLPDPQKLLKGSASLVRSLDIEAASTLARPAVATLIDEAIARNRVEFAGDGQGPAVILSKSTKKKRKPRLAKRPISRKQKSG